MVWPVAALAVLILVFVIVYGTVVQSRLEAVIAGPAFDPLAETNPDQPDRPANRRGESPAVGVSPLEQAR